MIILKYHQRLGDVMRMLPIARHYAAQSREVYVECLPQYHSLFRAVTYARPCLPGSYQHIPRIDLEIWPDRYGDYRVSKKTWEDFVYEPWPGLDRRIVFDALDPAPSLEEYGMAPNTSLVAPFGYSQVVKPAPAFVCQKGFDLFGAPLRILAEPRQAEAAVDAGWSESLFVSARSIPDMIRLVRDAANLLTVNSAPAIASVATRGGCSLIRSVNAQDDVYSDRARVVTLGA